MLTPEMFQAQREAGMPTPPWFTTPDMRGVRFADDKGLLPFSPPVGLKAASELVTPAVRRTNDKKASRLAPCPWAPHTPLAGERGVGGYARAAHQGAVAAVPSRTEGHLTPSETPRLDALTQVQLPKVKPDVLEAIHRSAERHLEQLFDDAAAFAKHARQTTHCLGHPRCAVRAHKMRYWAGGAP